MTSPDVNLPRCAPSAVTLVDTFVPRVDGGTAQVVRDVLLIVAGAALTALAAQVSFTIGDNPVPYTLQTAAVLVTGTALGAGRGFASMALYVAAGALGMGVFADGRSGSEPRPVAAWRRRSATCSRSSWPQRCAGGWPSGNGSGHEPAPSGSCCSGRS